MEYKDRLKAARRHAGLTQTELADKVGITQTSISDLERGKSASSSYNATIARHCGVSAAWLEDETPPMILPSLADVAPVTRLGGFSSTHSSGVDFDEAMGQEAKSGPEIRELNKAQFDNAALEALSGLNEVQARVIANELRTDEIKRLIRALKPFRGTGEAATPVAPEVAPPPRPAAHVVALHPVEANATLIGELSMWDGETPLADDEVAIPLFDEVKLAAGSGSTEVAEVPGMMLRFAKATLREAGVRPDKAACAIVRGDSMERLILNGATIGIDLGATEIVDGEIYAFEQDGALRVKYLYRLPNGGLRIHSENEAEYPDEALTAKQAKGIRILGSVFWWSTVRRRRGPSLPK